jgi:hypothetical protein
MTKQILAFFFLLHKRAKPAPPLTLSLTSARELKPYTPPLPYPSPPRANSNPILPPYLLPLPTYPLIPTHKSSLPSLIFLRRSAATKPASKPSLNFATKSAVSRRRPRRTCAHISMGAVAMMSSSSESSEASSSEPLSSPPEVFKSKKFHSIN